MIGKDIYSGPDRYMMRQLLLAVDVYYRNQHGAIRRKAPRHARWAWLRKNRGRFDRQPSDPTRDVVIEAEGRDDWIGWLELTTESVNEQGTGMAARVITDIEAESLAIVDAEDRPSLLRFNTELLQGRHRHLMRVDGNDECGIDVGILTRVGWRALYVATTFPDDSDIPM